MSEWRVELPTEVRMVKREDGTPVIEGHAAMFDQWYTIGPEKNPIFRERIMSGAFADVIDGEPEDTAALFNHDPNYLLGRLSAGTLRMSEDDTGLAYEVDPPESRADVVEAIDRGDVQGNSFAFTIAEQIWNEEADDGVLERTITKIGALYDVGPVVYPANPGTDVALRELRDAGFGTDHVTPDTTNLPDPVRMEDVTESSDDPVTAEDYGPLRAAARARAAELRMRYPKT